MNITLIKFIIYTIIIFSVSYFLYEIKQMPFIIIDEQFSRLIFIILLTLIITQYRFKKFDRWLMRVVNSVDLKIFEEFKKLNQQLNKTYSFKAFLSKISNAWQNLDQKFHPIIYLKEERQLIYLNETHDTYLNINWDAYFTKDMESTFDQVNYLVVDTEISTQLQSVYTIHPDQLKKFKYMILLETGSIVIGAAFIPELLFQRLNNEQIASIMNRLFLKIPNIYNRSKLFDETQRSLKERQFLIQLGNEISSTLSLNHVLNTLMNELKKIISYDAAGIFLLTNDGAEYEDLITVGYKKDKVQLFLKKSHQGLSANAVTTKETIYIPDVLNENKYFEARKSTRSQVTIPIIQNDIVIGAFTLESDEIDHFSEQTINLLEVVSQQASIAIVNAKLFEDSKKKIILEKEMINASQIQKALLPKRAPHIDGYDITMLSIPCKYVAGDIIDILKYNDDNLIFAIGDVSGKGSPASILMAVLFSGLRSQLDFNYQVSEHNARLNNLLYETTSSMYYATYFLGYLDLKNKILTYSNAGHTPPIIIKKNNERRPLGTGGMVLGFLENQIYTQERIQLEQDDIIVMFTDGLDEAFNLENKEFGVDRICDIVTTYKDQPSSIIRNKIIEAVQEFHGVDKEFEDDITLMIVKVN